LLILLKCRIEYKREREGVVEIWDDRKEDLIPSAVPHHTPFPFVSLSACINVSLLTPKHKLPRQLNLLVLTLSLILLEQTQLIRFVKSSRWQEQENGSSDSRKIYRGVWAIQDRPVVQDPVSAWTYMRIMSKSIDDIVHKRRRRATSLPSKCVCVILDPRIDFSKTINNLSSCIHSFNTVRNARPSSR